jgi:PadR family transcriptional regulator, regulatory protein PadR
MGTPRITAQTLKVFALFLGDVTAEWHGFDLIEQTKIKSGTMYPILIRLEKAGWLQSRLEDVDPSVVGRPARRLYALTGEGERVARAEVTAHLEALTPAPRPAPVARERFA